MSVHWDGATRLTPFASGLTAPRDSDTVAQLDFAAHDPVALLPSRHVPADPPRADGGPGLQSA